jgi:hypothetical protein
VTLNLLADGFDGDAGEMKAFEEELVFAEQAEEEMLGFDVGRAVLAGFVTRREEGAAGLLGVAFEHADS